jgi:hypothetical protein
MRHSNSLGTINVEKKHVSHVKNAEISISTTHIDKKPSGVYNPIMLAVYANTFSLMFAFASIVPTSANLTDYFVKNRKLSGLLVGLNEYGAVLMQPIQFYLFKFLNFKDVLIICLACEVIGGLLYTLSVPTGAESLIFVGRSICGVASGLQLVSKGLMLSIDDHKNIHTAGRINMLMYQLGAPMAYFSAAFFIEVATDVNTSHVGINQATWPTLTSSVISFCILLYVIFGIPRIHSKPIQSKNTSHTQSWLIIPQVNIGFLAYGYMEGLRQVTLFELFHERWITQTNPAWTLSTTCMYSAFIFVLMICTFPLDAYFSLHKWSMFFVSFGIVVSVILLIPYDIDTGTSIALFAVGSVIHGFLGRILGTWLNIRLVKYCSTSPRPNLWIMLQSQFLLIGVGLGATVATFFDLSFYPFIVFIILMSLWTFSILFIR